MWAVRGRGDIARRQASDIIVRLSEGPVILETEREPSLTVEADALSRLGMTINGRRVQKVFALTISRDVPLDESATLVRVYGGRDNFVAGVVHRRYIRSEAQWEGRNTGG